LVAQHWILTRLTIKRVAAYIAIKIAIKTSFSNDEDDVDTNDGPNHFASITWS